MLRLMAQALRDDPNKLGAGNAGVAMCARHLLARRVFWTRGGRFLPGNFGRADRAIGSAMAWAGLAWAVIGAIWRRGRNGGFLPIRGRSIGQVRTGESEWAGQGVGFAGFSERGDQPVRLHRAAWAPVEVGPEGVAPLRDPRRLPSPVAHGSHRFGEKFPDLGQARPIGACSAGRFGELRMSGWKNSREIPPIPLGSGVRAAQSARFSDRSERRPKFSATVGLGGGWSRSCAKRFSEARRMTPGPRRVK